MFPVSHVSMTSYSKLNKPKSVMKVCTLETGESDRTPSTLTHWMTLRI